MARTAADKRLTFERIARLQQQNKKLAMEVQQLNKQLVDPEQLKRDVIQCNLAVKARLLSLPSRLAPKLAKTQSVREAHDILKDAIRETLENLAYNSEGEAA